MKKILIYLLPVAAAAILTCSCGRKMPAIVDYPPCGFRNTEEIEVKLTVGTFAERRSK